MRQHAQPARATVRALVAVAAHALAVGMLAACGEAGQALRSRANAHPVVPQGAALRVVAGDPARGRELLTRHGCTACHAVPGEQSPNAHAGPPLTQFARRTNIGGTLPNHPEQLVRFIMNSPGELPGTGMPNLAVSEDEARHIAALLYTWR